MNTLYFIITLFFLGALGGAYLLTRVLRNKETPKLVALVHGAIGATALALLIVYNFRHPGFIAAIALFVVAATGGFVLVARDLTGKPLPKWLALAHGLIAVSGFVVLLVLAFNNGG